jgi:hypothetical protein
MNPDPDRQAIIDQSVARYRKMLERQLPDDNATLEQIEDAIEEISKVVMPDLQERLVNERAKKARDNQVSCPCGGMARYRSMGTRTLITRHGPLIWRRPTYYCNACHTGSAPLDATLRLDKGETTPTVREWVALIAPREGFVETAEVLHKLRGIQLSASTVERIAVSVGSSLRRAQVAEAVLHKEDQLPDRRTVCPRRLYVGADGVMAPLRDPWKKDGSLGKLNCRWGECKSGVVYQTYQDEAGRDNRVSTRAYIATTEDVTTFEPLLGMLAHRCGHHAAKEVVVLGDGAAWIWNMFARQFPGSIQILDFSHACEHLAWVSDAMFGKGTDIGLHWQKERQAELKDNAVKSVIATIASWQPRNQEHCELQRTQVGYFTDNAERMRYKTYLEKGYHIGSGVVEATCKHVVAQRLDQAGMHWRSETADAIITLRADQRSTNKTDLRPHLAMAA